MMIEHELVARSVNIPAKWDEVTKEVIYYVNQYERSGMADIVILSHLVPGDMGYLSTEHLKALAVIITGMVQYMPFEVITIHDEFKCHANNMNHLRQQYINVLAELADSNVLSDILGQLHGVSCTYTKLSSNLSTLIRNSNYALS
jgi:hypothetical protein